VAILYAVAVVLIHSIIVIETQRFQRKVRVPQCFFQCGCTSRSDSEILLQAQYAQSRSASKGGGKGLTASITNAVTVHHQRFQGFALADSIRKRNCTVVSNATMT
jgi:hypothetical protein